VADERDVAAAVERLVTEFTKLMTTAVKMKRGQRYDDEESFRNKANEKAEQIVARLPAVCDALAQAQEENAALKLVNTDAGLRHGETQRLLAEARAVLGAVGAALDGQEVSDFMKSFPVVRRVVEAQQEIARLQRSVEGWKADALNYARSRECWQQMTEHAKALARTLAQALRCDYSTAGARCEEVFCACNCESCRLYRSEPVQRLLKD